ncbi:hypothetical protein G6F57_021521 [Rhizopus arrhizus]|nr:hypothetical protein G6F57_021521 [Rhizopus arrhizus]
MGVVEPGQVIAEIGEVVAHADAEITPDIAVDTGQPTLPAAAVAHVQQAVLQQPMPLVVQVVTQLAGGEVGGRVEPRTGTAPIAHFAFAAGRLRRHFPALVDAIHALK